MGRYVLATILLLAFTGAVQAATPSSERRTALVIGNSDYELISPLRNPVNDARAMARVLSDLGFELFLVAFQVRGVLVYFLRELERG